MGTVGILKACSLEFLNDIVGYLRSDEFKDLDVIMPPITRNYHWFFTDIVAASDPTMTTVEQARRILLLNRLIENSDVFKQRDPQSTLVLPTGDGMAIGFDDSPEKPLLLAMEVHKGLRRYNQSRKKENQVQIRIGLENGPVYMIRDINGNENVWGPGIIMARRVMDLADKMNILASARFAADVRSLKSEYRQMMHLIGDYKIKHGDRISIYNIYTDAIGNKKAPPTDRSQKSLAAREVKETGKRFVYSFVGIEIHIKDAKTMLAHHVMTWELVNISDQSLERIFYFLDGDIPRSFPDLNVSIKDEQGQELDIMSLNVNKPLHKEFFVKFRKPMKPGERGRIAKLEYDWEEPDRNYSYRFASDCKKFSFLLNVPKGMEINQKVVRVEETGDKFLAASPPLVKYLQDRTEVAWSARDIRAHEAYRFDW